jgi:hypothetical protein
MECYEAFELILGRWKDEVPEIFPWRVKKGSFIIKMFKL